MAPAGNITPYPRKIVYLTLNAVSNYIRTPTRPEYIAHRDFTPIQTGGRRRAGAAGARASPGGGVAFNTVIPGRRVQRRTRAHLDIGFQRLGFRVCAKCAASRNDGLIGFLMNLHRLLNARHAAGKPVRVALIGAGKFGSMFLSQVPHTPGLEVSVIIDLDRDRAREACRTVGWDAERIARTAFTDDGARAIAGGAMDVVVEATGNPAVGIRHARAAIAAGKHVVMVNVEADVLAGPLLAEEARKAGVVYSLAYGDQPALTAEMVDWARATGFRVVAAGKGTKYLPAYHDVTPDGVWGHYGLTAGEAQSAGMNPQMFNSFLDGTKSAIEMAAIANACGLDVPSDGLLFPPCGVDDLPHVMRPRDKGGVLEKAGLAEVVSSLERDGRPVFRDLRWGVYVVLEAPNDYAADCFKQYGLKTDASGRYAAMYKPYHLIGLELNISDPVGGAAQRADRAAA